VCGKAEEIKQMAKNGRGKKQEVRGFPRERRVSLPRPWHGEKREGRPYIAGQGEAVGGNWRGGSADGGGNSFGVARCLGGGRPTSEAEEGRTAELVKEAAKNGLDALGGRQGPSGLNLNRLHWREGRNRTNPGLGGEAARR